MALIDCSECGKQISDKAESCPNCGNPIKPQKKEDLMKCPYCKSTQLTTSKKGFSAGKALAGGVLLGGVGLLAGTLGSGSVKITCLKCGRNFKAGDYQKEAAKRNEKPIPLGVYKFFIVVFVGLFFWAVISLASNDHPIAATVFGIVIAAFILLLSIFHNLEKRQERKRELRQNRQQAKAAD